MKRSTFLAVFVLVLILWGAITLFYHLGASGVDFGGTTASFDREHDRKVLRIREGVGIAIHTDDPQRARFDLMSVTRASFPFCPLCGTYTTDGAVVLDAAFHQGDWFYRAPYDGPLAPGARRENLRGLAYNRATGQRVEAADGASASEQRKQLDALHLDAADPHRITPQSLAGMPALAMVQESCLVFNAAFLFVTGLWMLIGLVSWLVRRARTRPAAR